MNVDDSQGWVGHTMTVEPYTDLRCDVGQQERLVHRVLRDLCVSSGHPNPTSSASTNMSQRKGIHVSPIVSAPKVILKLCAEHGRQRLVFGKGRPRPVARFVVRGRRDGRFTQRGEGEVFGRLRCVPVKGVKTCGGRKPTQAG